MSGTDSLVVFECDGFRDYELLEVLGRILRLWNMITQFFKARLNKGKNVLTVHILTNGNMNLAYFEFPAGLRWFRRCSLNHVAIHVH